MCVCERERERERERVGVCVREWVCAARKGGWGEREREVCRVSAWISACVCVCVCVCVCERERERERERMCVCASACVCASVCVCVCVCVSNPTQFSNASHFLLHHEPTAAESYRSRLAGD